MNQILSVNMPSGSNSNRNYKPSKNPGQKANIKSVLIFFVAVIFIFGVILVLVGSMSMKNKGNEGGNKADSNKSSANKPRIDIVQEEMQVVVAVTGDNNIKTVEYVWDNENSVVKEVGNLKSVDLNIDIPEGNKTLKVIVTDTEGLTNSFENQYVGPEAFEANISLEQKQDTNDIYIKCKSESKIKYVEYSFNGQNSEKTEVNDTSAEILLKKQEGDSNLKIVAVSEDGKKCTKEAPIILTKIDAKIEGENFKINASNSDGISKVEMYINGKTEKVDVNNKEFEKIIPLQSGNNKIGIMVYNKDGVMTRKIWTPTK